MNLSNKLNLKQTQNLKFQLIQKIQQSKLMEMSRGELLEKIREEHEKNPALTIIEKEKASPGAGTKSEYNEYRRTKSTKSGALNQEASDNYHKFMEAGIASETTLQDYLLEQLHFQSLEPENRSIGERLISNLNDNGFYQCSLESFFDTGEDNAQGLFKPEEKPAVLKMIELIRTFDPVGTCVQDARESLLVQTILNPDAPEGMEDIFTRYWDLVLKKNFEAIRKNLGLSPMGMEKILNFMKTLNPYPGASFAKRSHMYIVPDVIIKRKEGWFEVRLYDDDFPTLSIDSKFNAISKSEEAKKEEKDFIRDKVQNAEVMIKLLNYRNSTLLKVCKAIFEFQLDYFTKGPEFVSPLTLKDIAEEVNLASSTISRVVKGKYIQTDNGVFPLKYFFATPIPSLIPGHPGYSNIEVMFRIKRILERTDSKISDKDITNELVEKGIDINRRTVNKYRNKLLSEWN